MYKNFICLLDIVFQSHFCRYQDLHPPPNQTKSVCSVTHRNECQDPIKAHRSWTQDAWFNFIQGVKRLAGYRVVLYIQHFAGPFNYGEMTYTYLLTSQRRWAGERKWL